MLTTKQKQLINAMQTTTDMKELSRILNWKSRNLMLIMRTMDRNGYISRVKKGTYQINKDDEMEHKFTEKQKKLIEAMEITGNIPQLEILLKWTRKELTNLMRYLYERNFVNRVSKNTYEINRDYPDNKKANLFHPIEIDGKLVDVNKIPREVQEYLWANRRMPCSQLRLITKLPRFYIRQYIYERKIREYPRLKEY